VAPPHLTAQPARAILWGQAKRIASTTTRITVKNFPTLFLALLVGTLAFGYMAREDNAAIARCENRGGHIDECRLIVLGR